MTMQKICFSPPVVVSTQSARPTHAKRAELVSPLLFKEGWHAERDGVVNYLAHQP